MPGETHSGNSYAECYAYAPVGDAQVEVRCDHPIRTLAVVPRDIGSQRQQWLMGVRIARALTEYHTTLRNRHEGAVRAFVVGLTLGLIVAVGVMRVMDMRPASDCVGNTATDYVLVPNG